MKFLLVVILAFTCLLSAVHFLPYRTWQGLKNNYTHAPETCSEEISRAFKEAHRLGFLSFNGKREKEIKETLSRGYAGGALEEKVHQLSRAGEEELFEARELVYFLPPRVLQKYPSRALLEAGFYYTYEEYNKGAPSRSWGTVVVFELEKIGGKWYIVQETWDNVYWD